ncbi:S9 family peptidase [Phenylobacterium sp.]|uniref:alpha/beta hydrolase family protein n=1 Tax=Phenylobacterium sp. TaxID=1871053 RepID=UPI00271ACC22|nr:alpha/beta hydrolase [Phenylobacterium sp.]MDO8802564.1 alpha/beta fold hydrolase [Phenylobacterium sp.]
MTSDISGDWHGVLDTGSVKVKLGFRLDGPAAWLNTQAAGVVDLPITHADGRLAFESDPFDIALTLAPVGDRLQGTCRQGGIVFPVTFERGVAPAVVHAARPQAPRPPFRYEVQDITFAGADGSPLSATLTLPKGKGPHQAVVLSNWFGQTGRDQLVAGHRPFAIWADDLTRRGFATLRFDRRGTGRSQGNFQDATTGDFAADLACAVAMLRDRSDIGAVGLLGHSEGGHISADVAAGDPAIAFCVLMTPTGVPDEVIVETELFRAIDAVGGMPQGRDRIARISRALALASKAPSADEVIAQVRASLQAAGLPAARIELRAAVAATPWRRYWATYDHTASLRRLDCPTLVVFAEHDLQTAPRVHEAAITAALAGNPLARIVTLPGLNHFLQPAITGAPSEYGDIETTLDPSAIDAVCGWIAAL